MMQKSILFFLFLLIALWACESIEKGPPIEATEAKSLEELLPGTWESVSLKVFVNSIDGSDSSYIFDVPEKNWKEVFGMKPVKYVYQPNHKYYSEHRSVLDSVINVTRGMWNVFGDTIMLVTPEATYQYRVKIRKGLSEFRAFVDWDGDGAEDDEYIGIQRYVSMAAD